MDKNLNMPKNSLTTGILYKVQEEKSYKQNNAIKMKL